jgi:hypothetical protein
MSQRPVLDERRVGFERPVDAGVPAQIAARQIGIGRTRTQRSATLHRLGGTKMLASPDAVTTRYLFAVRS